MTEDKTQKTIKRNAVRCRLYGDIIESEGVHDLKNCSCGNVSVDGGHDYLRRCFRTSADDFEELSEFEQNRRTGRIQC